MTLHDPWSLVVLWFGFYSLLGALKLMLNRQETVGWRLFGQVLATTLLVVLLTSVQIR